MTDAIVIRPARPADVAGIAALINGYAAERIMLFRTPESIELTLHDFLVAADAHGRVLACGALKEYSPSLAEVASVAVSRDAHGFGLGRRIVQAVERLAERRGVEELFALTTTPAFFEAVGYQTTDRAHYPEKIRRDCLGCARRMACPEVCVRRPVAAEVLAAAA
ncbi:MAG TPA: GNAT family N-acetyltransferase [Gemmatimonadaceae bacterium]|nr:GNAT family N-acetyltransferase [Gemmatimonadaceae bacterium]